MERTLKTLVLPLALKFGDTLLHLHRHGNAGSSVLSYTPCFRIAEKGDNCIPNIFVERGTIFEGDTGHLVEIPVEDRGQFLEVEVFSGLQ
jgi:hypothetical protein